MKEYFASGQMGEVYYYDSTRINLGIFRSRTNVIWDLAPHDLSILDYVLPGGLTPLGVAAQGADPLGAGKSCVGYLTLPLANGAMAHVHVNWLSPTKIRQMVIGGSERTLVWDDLNPQQRLSIYDRGVDLVQQSVDSVDRRSATVSYRLGDTWAPALDEREALGVMVTEFAAAIREGRPAGTDGNAGLRVLSVLEAAGTSLRARGALVDVADTAPRLELVR
jgi:predicted dehydrogenase